MHPKGNNWRGFSTRIFVSNCGLLENEMGSICIVFRWCWKFEQLQAVFFFSCCSWQSAFMCVWKTTRDLSLCKQSRFFLIPSQLQKEVSLAVILQCWGPVSSSVWALAWVILHRVLSSVVPKRRCKCAARARVLLWSGWRMPALPVPGTTTDVQIQDAWCVHVGVLW